MKILTYYRDDVLRLALYTDEGLIDVSDALGKALTPDNFYQSGLKTLEELRNIETASAKKMAIESLKLGPCVPNPGKIICVGLNYARHAKESGMAAPTSPVLFSKFNNSIAADQEIIPFSKEYTQLDYEAELVVVIGREARHIPAENALDYVLGYCNGNDLSERALQLNLPGGQWLIGKTCDKFLPIGPYVVSKDEAGDPQKMSIKGWLNGKLRQDSDTSDMIFSVAEIIAYISRFMTLLPGDIISTGTPEGVILGMKEKVWMQAGDEFVIEIGNLGRLTNKVEMV